MYEQLAVLAAFALAYSALAGRIEKTWITGPILFTLFGVIFGRHGLGLLSTDAGAETLRTLAEFTLALVLFSDAAGADLKTLRKVQRLPIRLLAIGLPLTILLGFGVGKLTFAELSVFEIALLATMLAPTDAALGKGVVSNEAVPGGVRQGLNVESGLNDGICVPILFLFLALASGEGDGESPWHVGLGLFAEEVGIGLACGLVITAAAVWLLKLCTRLGWLSETWSKVIVVLLAFTCFGAAQALGGSGFIASFVGGLLFGGLMRADKEPMLKPAEGIGDVFSLLTWVFFGSVVVGQISDFFDWSAVLYAVLSLTVIRMLPVFLVLIGMGMSTEAKLFTGWFGPRGLASVVFIVIVMGDELPGEQTMATVVGWTVVLSIVLHGITANPWAKRFGARAGKA
jgi:NhaP-type Na+/H+ or K+/H+ antiporter